MDKQLILKKISAFKGLSPAELQAIVQLSNERKYKKNDVIFAEKSRGEEIYILTKGRVRIELGVKGKTDFVTVHRIQKGEIFGELALVGDGNRSASAECETDCDVIVINRDALRGLFEKNTRIGYIIMANLASVLSTRLRKTNLQLVACFLWE